MRFRVQRAIYLVSCNKMIIAAAAAAASSSSSSSSSSPSSPPAAIFRLLVHLSSPIPFASPTMIVKWARPLVPGSPIAM